MWDSAQVATTAKGMGGQGPAVAMVLGSCTSLQVGAAIAVPVMGEVGSWLTTAVRLLFASAILIAVTRPQLRSWNRGQWRRILFYGLSLGGMNGSFYAAIDRIPLAIAVTIEFLGPLVLAAVLSRRVRDFCWVLVAAVAIAVLGLADSPSGPLDPVGVAFAFVSALFWALYILAGKAVATKVRGQAPLAIAMLIGGAIMVPLAAPSLSNLTSRPKLLLPLVGVALLSSVIPYSLELAAMRQLPARVFGVLLSLEPVVAGIFGWLLLGQHLALIQVPAMIAVLAASIATTLSSPAPQPPEVVPPAAT